MQILTHHKGSAAPPVPRTERGLAFEAHLKEVRRTLRGMTAHERDEAKRVNDDFLRALRDPQFLADYRVDASTRAAVTPYSVHSDELLANLSIMHTNDAFIGEQLMPILPVNKLSGKYVIFDRRNRMAAPDDRVGPRGKANEIAAGTSEGTYLLEDFALSKFIDLALVKNHDAPYAEMVNLVVDINDALSLKREQRILAILATGANYAGNTAEAAVRWDDTTGGSIISDIAAADAAIWSGSNSTRKIGFCSLAVWNGAILNNPQLRTLFAHTEGGLVTRQQLARHFGLDDILVSRVRQDTANEGQTASYSRVLTDDVFGIVTVATSPSLNSAHFGVTFRMDDMPLTTQWDDPSVGTRGGIHARVSNSEQHKVIAGDAGFLITDILA